MIEKLELKIRLAQNVLLASNSINSTDPIRCLAHVAHEAVMYGDSASGREAIRMAGRLRKEFTYDSRSNLSVIHMEIEKLLGEVEDYIDNAEFISDKDAVAYIRICRDCNLGSHALDKLLQIL